MKFVNATTASLRSSSLTECNTVGSPLGARKRSAAAQVSLSDVSDTDDNVHGLGEGLGSVSSVDPKELTRQQRRQQPQYGAGKDGAWDTKPPAAEIRRSTKGPAAALTSRVVATVRRRMKHGLQRTVAVAAPPPRPAAVAATVTELGVVAHSPFPAAAHQPTNESSRQPYRHATNRWDLRRTTAIAAVAILLAAAAAASGLLLAPRRTGRGAAGGETAAGRSAAAAGGGFGAASASGAVTSWSATSALPYMAGWARLLGGMAGPAPVIAARLSQRSSSRHVVTASFAPQDRAHNVHRGSSILSPGGSSSSSSRGGSMLLRRWWWWWWYGTTAAGTGAAPHRDSSSRRRSSSSSSTLAVAKGEGTGGEPPTSTGGDTGATGQPPQPQDYEWREAATVRVITVVPDGGSSPYRTSWGALADHTAARFEWTDPSYQMMVFRAQQLGMDAGIQRAFLGALQGGAQMVVGLAVADGAAEAFLQDPRVTSKLPDVVLFAGGSESLSQALTRLQHSRLPWTPDGRGLAVWDTVQLLLGRYDSDNFLFVYLVLVNQYVTTVRQVADTTKGFDLQSLICMIKNCGSKVVGCVQDPTCKSALDCLQACTFNDQVCQYRCIVSYESPLLEQFSLCILQLHNCRNLDAKPPLLPDPAPMASFRGAPLTHGSAEELFFGWLDEPRQGAPASSLLGDRKGKPYSWLVAAGKNPAYDYFPCQHQLYYKGRGRGQLWYEPVFKAITVDGREVWRRRVYRVRQGKVPGTFHLSVLDNGVTSNEFWRILDCHEGLDYCLFYYSGAASTAGLSYSGAILATPDGRMPGPQHTDRLHGALRRAGIEPWELSYVDNSNCEEAPLKITGPVAPPAPSAAY
ncbi:hypothetical protein VOLCADRAFT_95570 [Volvox carteri f. nagariensis]|uniref:VDE lipocalin domain-containing protein n=1 Tax=Volvox carteri f. nagariensis TaxID=3068 RepID=D8U7Y9_VOLCA|nr:uncharacterized protein VOLCADRAFT_95570 [Volvox carteri f. nagariensis]EFJ44124.1 hypothetical protein VOLCADRAFT_95570 [Volvox carteri f. nagariensis]|eukprot:XP_002954718.1 hypothetical protein VOLCADRAFT_95570 [Volvox carteri f. nagariensis]